MKKAILLLSGGLDSTTTLYYAQNHGYQCHALIFDYGQRHKRELRSALAIAKKVKIPYHVLKIGLPWKGSSLLDKTTKVPVGRSLKKMTQNVPSTYVPARNTIFLSFALSYAEAIGARFIFIGANAVDFSGYPDCRPKYYRSFHQLIKHGTRAGKIKIMTPLLHKTKAQIIALAMKLKVPIDMTWSCYAGGKKACGICDSCQLRDKGLRQYQKTINFPRAIGFMSATT